MLVEFPDDPSRLPFEVAGDTSDLTLKKIALFLHHDNIAQAARKLAHRLRFNGAQQTDLEKANPSGIQCAVVVSQIPQGLARRR